MSSTPSSLPSPFPPSIAASGQMVKGATTIKSLNSSYGSDSSSMKIDIPKNKEAKDKDKDQGVIAKKYHATPHSQHHQQQHAHHQYHFQSQPQSHPQHQQHLHGPFHHQPAHPNTTFHSLGREPLLSPASVIPHNDTASIPPRTSSTVGGGGGSSAGAGAGNSGLPANWVHHPRKPTATADSYFPHLSAPGGGHLGVGSSPVQPPKTPGSIRGHSRQASGATAPGSALVPSRSGKTNGHTMSLSLSGGGGHQQADFANFAGPNHAGPPSPSTLTDIILGLHSTLYAGKRTPEEVRERVAAFYDHDAVFESPLLSAKGREQIANQFIMAFSLPGMDVTSELRDVICSDFEFDGTRAGIIDQTISVTIFPKLFGSQTYPPSHGAPQYEAHPPGDYNALQGGTSTPGYTLQSAGITPHPFATYSQVHTPAGGAGSMFSRFGLSRPHSPTTPFSVSSLWASSRPHTPGAHHSAQVRPLSTASTHPNRPSTPPSVNGDDEEGDYGTSQSTIHAPNADENSRFVTAQEAGGGQVTRPQMPSDAIAPHWTSDGLGRASVRALLWGILHPRAVLKSLCTIHLRLMTRLEFNDAGHIVRHEDSWGLRETIEGTIPFASVVYALERRVVGYLCSFAVGKGFRLSSALTRSLEARNDQQRSRRSWSLMGGDEKNAAADANDAARALLLGQHHRQEQLHSMARSRASSPSRHRFSGQNTPFSQHYGTGSRSRARSLVGQQVYGFPTRAASTDNLVAMSHSSMSGYGERERGSTTGGDSLPPDSSARYRERGLRRPTSSTASAPVGLNSTLDSLWQQGDISSQNLEGPDSKSRAPDRDGSF